MIRIRFFGRELAYATSYRYALIHGSYKLGQETVSIEWCRWSFETLYWSHATALLALQGASLQQMLPALLVLRGVPKPPYDPLPGARGVVVAEIFSAPELSHRRLFELLLPEAGGASSPASL